MLATLLAFAQPAEKQWNTENFAGPSDRKSNATPVALVHADIPAIVLAAGKTTGPDGTRSAILHL
jgi:hypothetical protein